MRILACHNYYQIRGGEDQSFEDEVCMLRDAGHEVVIYSRHNDDIAQRSRGSVALQTLWNRHARRELEREVESFAPDIVHFTNTFPQISPAAYGAARSRGAAVVQSLRNYRLMCAGAYFLRDGVVCEDCLGKRIAMPAIRHKCYRNSRAGSAVVAASNALHNTLGTTRRGVDVFYTLTEFARSKFVEAGLPAERLLVKPNCVNPDPGVGPGPQEQTAGEQYAVFAGRLSPEKGLPTLFEAWDQLAPPQRLKIVGDGPLADEVAAYAAGRENVEFVGKLPHCELLTLIGGARLLVMPSVWYETFGRTIIEAYAKGTPVVASRLGAMAELLHEGETGLLAKPGDATDWARCITQLADLPIDRYQTMRERCRQEYENRYTPDRNVELLLDVYHQALSHRGVRVPNLAATGAATQPC